MFCFNIRKSEQLRVDCFSWTTLLRWKCWELLIGKSLERLFAIICYHTTTWFVSIKKAKPPAAVLTLNGALVLESCFSGRLGIDMNRLSSGCINIKHTYYACTHRRHDAFHETCHILCFYVLFLRYFVHVYIHNVLHLYIYIYIYFFVFTCAPYFIYT